MHESLCILPLYVILMFNLFRDTTIQITISLFQLKHQKPVHLPQLSRCQILMDLCPVQLPDKQGVDPSKYPG